MTYLIDAHHLGARQTGNETWIRNMVEQLARLQNPGQLAICVSNSDAPTPTNTPTYRVSGSAIRRLALDIPLIARTCRAAAILVQYTTPLTRRPCVAMVQDMASFDPEGSRWLGRTHAARIRASITDSVRRARVLLAPSVYTQHRIIERFGLTADRVLVAPIAIDSQLAALLDTREYVRQPVAGRVLVVGNVVPRKNLSMLGTALSGVRSRGQDVTLRVVGQIGRQGEPVVSELRDRLGTAVSFSGYVTLEDLVEEYRQAELLAFPSLHEGFGIPALEAMYAGVPVVASATTGLREVVQDAGVLVDPNDRDGWQTSITRLVTDAAARAELSSRGLVHARSADWTTSASIVLHALDIAAGQAGGAISSR